MSTMNPIFNPLTPYLIEVRGRVDVDWLQSFAGSVEISVDETRQVEDITVLKMRTDQSGIVGLVRRLHGLGMTILQVKIISTGGQSAGEQTSAVSSQQGKNAQQGG